jgi:hypothetical protein
MFLVMYVNGINSANNAKNDMFMALTKAGVGPGANIESHNDVAIEAIV